MTRKPSLLIMVLCCVLSTSWTLAAPNESSNTENIAEKIQLVNILHGNFVQQRSNVALTQALTSSGSFIYWKNQGIYWQTTKPFTQATTYSKDKTIIWQPNGLPDGNASNSSRDKHFRRILLSIFRFDLEELSKQFDSQWTFNDKQWQLNLSPRSTTTQMAIDSVALSGERFIEDLLIATPSGDQLSIDFSQLSTTLLISHDTCINKFGLSIDRCNQLTSATHETTH